MLKNILICVMISLTIVGCASVKLNEKNMNIVMARDAEKSKGPTGISDTFPLEGKIVAYMTFNWDDFNQVGGRKTIEVKWYSGDKLISVKKGDHYFTEPPYYVWFKIYGTALGVGKAKVEVYSDGAFLGSKNFEVTAK